MPNFPDIKKLFFENQSIKQTIFKNVFWLAVAEIVSRFLTVILFFYVARILGATEYGKFTFALAFVYLLSIFPDLGLAQITTRELAKSREKEKNYPSLLTLKTLLIGGTLILAFLGSFFITSDPDIQKIIWILATYIFVLSFTQMIYAFLEARQKMEYEAWAKILQALLFTGFGFFVIFNFPSVKNLAYAYCVGTLFFLTILLLFFHFKIYRLKFGWQISIWKNFLGMSWPLALSSFLVTIYSQTDTVMMGYWNQIAQTGWYNAAYRIAAIASIPMALISQSFFPALSKAFKESKEKLQKIWNYQLITMIFLALPITIGGVTLAPRIINFIFDPEYAPSILAFQILIVMVGIIFLANPLSQALVAANLQKKLVWAVLGGALANVGLNIVLIPKFSFYGAAIATVITNLLIFFLLIRFVLKYVRLNPFTAKILLSFIMAGFSSGVMYWIISLPKIYFLPVIFSILIGALVYFAVIFVFSIILRFFNQNFLQI